MDIANVLKGRHDFFPETYSPAHTAEECLKHVTFEGDPGPAELLRLAAKKAAIVQEFDPDRPRGYVIVLNAFTQESSLYRCVTDCMRRMKEVELARWRCYIFHLEAALLQQPRFHGVVFRGIDKRVPTSVYEPGSVITWQQFTSATRLEFNCLNFVEVIDCHRLSGTIFMIRAHAARCVREVSAFPSEEEVIFRANSQFKVDCEVKDDSEKRSVLPKLAAYDLRYLKVFKLQEIPSWTKEKAREVAAAAAPTEAPRTPRKLVPVLIEKTWSVCDERRRLLPDGQPGETYSKTCSVTVSLRRR